MPWTRSMSRCCGLPPEFRHMAFVDGVAELGDPGVEAHAHFSGGAVALFRDDQVGHAVDPFHVALLRLTP